MDQAKQRLKPLYISTFLEMFVLWYSIGKLFMVNIGFNEAQIGIAMAAMMGLSLLFEIPSGLLADKWSRKWTLVLGLCVLFVATLGTGLSNAVYPYAGFVALWGIYSALASGTKEAIVYDTVVELKLPSSSYKELYGRVSTIESFGLVAAALANVALLQVLEVRAMYLLTLPFTLLAIISIAMLREPTMHQARPGSSSSRVKQTFAEVVKQKELHTLVAILVTGGVILRIFYEFRQLWWIDLAVTPSTFGLLTAIIFFTGIVAGRTAPKVTSRQLSVIGVGIIGASALLLLQNIVAVFVAQWVIMWFMLTAAIVVGEQLQQRISSSNRAGSTSVVGFITSGAGLSAMLLFGFFAEALNVFQAAWMVVGLTAMLVLLLSYSRK